MSLTSMRWLAWVTATCFKEYPMKLTFNVTGREATPILKRPSKSVMTPFVVPSTVTLAENIGSPVSPSNTFPTSWIWACAPKAKTHNKQRVKACFSGWAEKSVKRAMAGV